MYRAVGEDSWRDGVFSHAAPGQAYQASTGQYRDGALGATVRMLSGLGSSDQSSFRDGSLGRKPLLPRLTRGQMSGIGTLASYRDGSLGQAFRDGSLGDGTTITLSPNAASVGPTPYETPFYKKPELWIGTALGLGIFYLAFKK